MIRHLICIVILGGVANAADREIAPAPKKAVDLTGYRTTKEAAKADPKAFPPPGRAPAQLGYLGVAFSEKSGKVILDDVESGSPADEAGLKAGDVVAAIDGIAAATASAAREKLSGRFADSKTKLIVEREGKAMEITIAFKPISKPLAPPDAPRAVLGLQSTRAGGGDEITRITAGGAAEKAGLKVGDIILKVDGKALESESALTDSLKDKRAGDRVTLFVQRDKKEMDVQATLTAANAGGNAGGWDDRLPTNFRKPRYNLAIVGVEYPDTKHNEKISDKDWENQLFSVGTYTGKNATGQTVYGSVADYYRELSYGKLKVEGKFLGWVEVSKKKMDYNLGSSTTASDKTKFFNEMMDKLIAKNGAEALKDYDGIFIVFAGDRVQTSRGGLYWPHKANFTHDKKRYSYFIVPEQSRNRMTDISVICHEFGHMLGLPDLYARPENPGSEGLGVWCAMSNQLPNGRPQHFSAWSKEQMGWLKPVAIDPRVKQKLILSPVEDAASECFKVISRSDGSEYFLLENRQQKGFDKDLPAGGLLVWRVLSGDGRGRQSVFLEEAHGIEGPSGPRVHPTAVPFPSVANHAFTPFTTPSSKSQLGGGLDVNITNIRKLPDGRVIFHVGYDYQ